MRRLVASVLLGALVAGCGGTASSPQVSPPPTASIAPPSCGCIPPLPPEPTGSIAPGEFDVVLRMTVFGGLPYPGITVEDPPDFSLYGDGHVVYTEDQTADNVHQVQLWHAQLTDAQVGELVGFALDDAGLRTARARYEDMPIYDVGSTIFEIHADGVDKSVFVYALGDFGVENPPDAEARAAFLKLKTRLASFGSRVRAGEIENLGEYEAGAYRVTLMKPWTELPVTAEWPWLDLEPDDFKPDENGNLVRWDITPEQGHAVLDLDIARELVATAADGKNYLIRILPLVPATPD